MKKISILSLHLGYGGIEKSVVSLANLLCKKYNVETIQFHPDLASGPYDGNKTIIRWIEEIEQSETALV